MRIDVVICTYDNAGSLDRVLAALGRQQAPTGAEWGILVVDNNCTDDTPAVLARHAPALPLRVVHEREQGLTPARLRGLRETCGEWLAYVDDDCVLAPDWIAQAAAAIRERPDAGGFGGEVTLEWEREPPDYARRHGWAFAEQRLGPRALQVGALAGAGMLLRRAAVEESGWARGPLLADRIGRRLVSGGDVELALRVAAVRPLYYDPRLTLRHLIPIRRAAPGHLVALVFGLGVSQQLADAMASAGGLLSAAPRRAWELTRPGLDAIRHRRRADALLAAAFLAGWLAGLARVARRRELVGLAVSSA